MLDWYESLPEWLRWILLVPVATASTFLILAVFSVVRNDFAFAEPFAAMLVPMVLVYFLAPRANSILALCTVFVRMILVGVMLTFVYRIEGFFTAETRVEILYEIIGYTGAIFVYWKFLRGREKDELRARQATDMTWLADKDARGGRIEKTVHKTIRDESFIVEKLEERRAYDVVVILALVSAYEAISSWCNMRTLCEFVEATNADVIAFELGIFTLYQAITEAGREQDEIIQRMKDSSGLSDEELEAEIIEAEDRGTPLFDDITPDLNVAVIMLKKMFRLEYGLDEQVHRLWGNRVNEYNDLTSSACENLALNLARIGGAKDFMETLNADEVIGKNHIALMLETASYRRRIIPAFMESVRNLYSMS